MAENREQITTQEINALRKAGKLEEALGKARRLFGDKPDDPWIVRTLFWCLYDEFKRVREGKDADTLAAVIQEVQTLKLPDEKSDQPMLDCAARILGTDPVAKATQLSKEGNHHDAVALLRPLAKGAGTTLNIGEAYGWILYRKLRDGDSTKPEVVFWCLKEFLGCWNPDWEPNVMLFKCVLIQAKIHAEGWNGLLPLVEKLGLHRLTAEQFADDRPDSDFEPFQDQLLTAIHKCLKKHPALHVHRPALHQLLSAWKTSFGDGEWPQYHLGRILLWTGGDPDHTRSLLLKTVQRSPGDFWRWQAFAETLTGDDAKAALSRGVLCRCEDGSFKVPLYKDYAELLAREGQFTAAKASLLEAMRLRQLTGNAGREPTPIWFDQAPPDEAIDIHSYAEPFAAKEDERLAADLPSSLCILIRPLQKEDRFLYFCPGSGTRTLKFRHDQSPPLGVSAVQAKFEEKEGGVSSVLAWKATDVPSDIGVSETGVVTHVNHEKQLTSVTTTTQDFIPLFFDRWPQAPRLSPGTFLRLQWLEQPDNKPIVLNWSVVDPRAIAEFVILVQGRFELARGQAFGFIEMTGKRVFVAPDQAKTLQDSSLVSGWAIRSPDKQGRPSWKLLPVKL